MYMRLLNLAVSVRYRDEQGDDDESRWYDLRDTLLEYHSSEENNEEYADL